jgi:hypothetical protein
VTAPTRPPAVAAAVALLFLPVLAFVVKLAFPGWLVLAGLVVSPVLLVGYVTIVLIGVLGFLTPRALFLGAGAPGVRAVIAAWSHGAAILLAALFVVDFGDAGPGISAFTTLVGAVGDDEVESLSSSLAAASALLGVGAWFWLLLETVVAAVRRRRSRPV